MDSQGPFGAETLANKCGDKPHQVFHVVGTSVDMMPGSSGGTMLAPDIEQSFGDSVGEYTAQELVGIGVAAGAKWDRSKYSHDEWDNAGPVPLEDENRYDGKNVNWFTGIVDPTFLRRDGPEKVKIADGDPEVCERGQHQDCIRCQRYDANDKCVELVYEASSRSTSSGDQGVSNDPFVRKGTKENDDKSAKFSTRERLVRCKYNGDMSPSLVDGRPEVVPGMIVGVMGAATASGRYVGDLQLICAPMSSLSYTENWRFLHTKGASIPWHLSLLQGYKGWGYFAPKMHDRFLKYSKAKRGQKIRPVPMKLCPPNYLMNGVKVRTDGKGITGIVSLECRKPINEKTNGNATGADQISVYLDANESDVDGFTLYGEKYSLDQRIGNPTETCP